MLHKLVSLVHLSFVKWVSYRSGTVRSPQKGDYLANIFAEYKGRFEYIVVEDMIKVIAPDFET